MADKTIGELPSLTTMEDDTLIPVEHDGAAKKMAGTVLESYVYDCVEDDVETIAEIIAIGPPGVSPTLSSSKAGKVTTIYYTDATHTSGTDVLATLQDGQDGAGTGDMLKATYDTDADGIVDNAEQLGGHGPSYYQTAITASGILKGNGSAISAATAGTDYVAPSVVGAASGIATLDSNSKVTASQVSARLVSFTSNTTLTAEHDGCWLYGNSTSARTITIPANTLPAGAEIVVMKYNTGNVTISAGSGVTLNGTSQGSNQITERYKSVVLKAMSANAWVIDGSFS